MRTPRHDDTDEIDEFFTQYLGFAYQREQPVYNEFYPAREEAWGSFRIAIVQSFNSTFGANADSLASWQRICRCLGVCPVPPNLHEARQAVLRTHVNLIDLLESIRTGAPPERFTTEEDLRDYTISEGKFFPKEEAYEEIALRNPNAEQRDMAQKNDCTSN
ncbi:hypothetical protein N7522_011923 [Penicillium canescens]|nr:hypothetical protein N7522_011923 [Penicillium canescens]